MLQADRLADVRFSADDVGLATAEFARPGDPARHDQGHRRRCDQGLGP
jgi:hypothetical protein